MFRFTFYTFTIAYVLLLIGAYQAFRYNSPKRSIIILFIAFLLDAFSGFCAATGFLTPRLTAGLGNNSLMILGWIFAPIAYIVLLLSYIPYKKGNLQLHQRMIIVTIIIWFLTGAFINRGMIELLAAG
jgi:hypothetical protein